MKVLGAIFAGIAQLVVVSGEPEAQWIYPYYPSSHLHGAPLVYTYPRVTYTAPSTAFGPIVSALATGTAYKARSGDEKKTKTAIVTYASGDLNALEKLIAKDAGRTLYHDRHLSELAEWHCEDLEAFYADTANQDSTTKEPKYKAPCTSKSWLVKAPEGHHTCCYDPTDKGSKSCSTSVEDNYRRSQEWKTYGSVYEINAWKEDMTDKKALATFKADATIWDQVEGKNAWSGKKINHFGCHKSDHFASCYFQEEWKP